MCAQIGENTAAKSVDGQRHERRKRFPLLRSEYLQYRYVNAAFTFLCFSLAPIAGSAVTIVFLAGAIWCTLHIAFGKPRLSADEGMIALYAPLLGYCVVAAVSTAANVGSLGDASIRMLPLLTFMVLPFSYSIWSISQKSTIAVMIAAGSMIACYGALALGFYQFYTIGARAEGGAGNSLVFATVTALAGTSALAGLSLGVNKLKLPLLGAWFAAFLAITYSEARTVWFTFLLVSVVVGWVIRPSSAAVSFRTNRWLFAATSLVALAVIFLTYDIVRDRLLRAMDDWQQIELLGNFDTAVGQRVAMWEIGTDLFSRHPFLGYGLSSAKVLLGQTLAEAGVSTTYTHFHNGLLTIAVEAGGFGLAFFVAFLAVVLILAVRNLRRPSSPPQRLGGIILLSTLVTYVLSGLTNLMIGHDILDAVLMINVIAGSYLACGTSLLDPKATAGDPAGYEAAR